MALVDFYQFATEKDAVDAAMQVDAGEGYPKVGVNVGGGIHVEPPFVTQRHAEVIQIHATAYLYPKTADTDRHLKNIPAPIVQKDYETDLATATRIASSRSKEQGLGRGVGV